MPMLGVLGLHFLMSTQSRRDVTVALVGFTSWAAVAWKLSRVHTNGGELAETVLALAAALVCLWPVALRPNTAGATYARWREWLIPAHLAAQHWIGLWFALPPEGQQLLQTWWRAWLQATPSWARGALPIFLATFCQPWLYLAFGAFLQRTRLRTFVWTQPLLLVPMVWMGREYCAAQLAATPEARPHLLRIAVIMQHFSAWLPVGPLLPRGSRVPSSSSGSGAATQRGLLYQPSGGGMTEETACLAVHLWLVVMLAYCLPAIVIHRLEGQEEQARQLARKRREQAERQQRRRQRAAAATAGDGGGGPAAAAAQPGAVHADGGGANGELQRELLLQRQQSVLGGIAELLLAGYSAWLLVQLALPILSYTSCAPLSWMPGSFQA